MPLRKMMFVKLGHNVTMCHFRTRLSGAFDDPEKIGLFSGFVFDLSDLHDIFGSEKNGRARIMRQTDGSFVRKRS